ncbi:MAG: diguanylate cyclase [Pseudomonadota bacterium]
MTSMARPLTEQTGKSLVILAVALLLLIGQSFLFLYQASEIRQREGEQENVARTLQHVRDVFSGLQDAETGQRGYLITGVDSYLDPYRSGSAAVVEQLAQTKALLPTDSAYAAQVQALDVKARRKLAELDETIRLRRTGNIDAALRRVQDGSGKHEMDQVRELMSSLMGHLREERAGLNAEVRRRVTMAAYVLLSIALTIVAMVCVATVQMMRIIHRNAELSVQLEMESTHDALTGLPNRRLFYTWLDKALLHAARKHASPSVLYFDLDGFKSVNDQFGHDTGDAVLRAAAARFATVVRNSDLLARLGGDEFAVVVNDDLSRDGLAALALRIMEALRAPLLPDLAADAIGVSIGIATFPYHGKGSESLVRAADEAMYQAKRAGKRRFRFASDGEPGER